MGDSAGGLKQVALIALALSPLVPPVVLPGLGTLVSLAIVFLTLLFVRSARAPTLASTGGSWRRALRLGLVAGLILALVFQFGVEPGLEWLTDSEVDLEDFAGVEGDLGKYLLLLALALVFGGVLEEVIFRGFVIGWGTALLGERAAIWLMLLSAVIFGLAHFYQGWLGVLTTGLVGLALGWIYLRGGRVLLPAILVHMLINFVGVTLIYTGYA
ncbi:MAG: type II CAAX endopeptidase family protein [Sphingomonadaceae bacterium]